MFGRFLPFLRRGGLNGAAGSIERLWTNYAQSAEALLTLDFNGFIELFSLNKDNLNVSIESFINNLNQLKSAVNKDPESVHSLLVDLKNFKEENY